MTKEAAPLQSKNVKSVAMLWIAILATICMVAASAGSQLMVSLSPLVRDLFLVVAALFGTAFLAAMEGFEFQHPLADETRDTF